VGNMKTWMKYVFSLALTLCCLETQATSWNSCSLNSSIERQRIDQVVIDEQGVFLLIDGCWLGAEGMQATQEGILVLENGAWLPLQEAVRCDNYYVWKCRNCGYYNPQGVSKCLRCGKH
jgi:hypothetical protein